MGKLVETGVLEPHGTGRGRTYTLSAALYRKAGKKSEYIRQASFAPIQQEQMVLNYIDKHGSIKRADVMDLCHVTQDQAYKLLLRLKKRGEIVQIGDRKGAVYERKRKYMRPFMRLRIKACIESAPFVVKDYSCGFASIRDSKDS